MLLLPSISTITIAHQRDEKLSLHGDELEYQQKLQRKTIKEHINLGCSFDETINEHVKLRWNFDETLMSIHKKGQKKAWHSTVHQFLLTKPRR